MSFTVHTIYLHLFSESISWDNYTYTTGIDTDDTFLFCNTEDSSVQLYNIYWRRKDGISYHTNPLDVYRLRNILILTNEKEMECFDTVSGNNIMSVGLYIQGLYNGDVLYICSILGSFALTIQNHLNILLTGPPAVTLSNGSTNIYSLLAPDTNGAEVTVLTQDVTLSVNLVGKWQMPNNSFVIGSSINFPIFYLPDEGLYKFYISDWYGQQLLAIQISIVISGM